MVKDIIEYAIYYATKAHKGKKLSEEELREIVIDIDNTNSTHIDSDNKGRYYIPKKIITMCKNIWLRIKFNLRN